MPASLANFVLFLLLVGSIEYLLHLYGYISFFVAGGGTVTIAAVGTALWNWLPDTATRTAKAIVHAILSSMTTWYVQLGLATLVVLVAVLVSAVTVRADGTADVTVHVNGRLVGLTNDGEGDEVSGVLLVPAWTTAALDDDPSRRRRVWPLFGARFTVPVHILSMRNDDAGFIEDMLELATLQHRTADYLAQARRQLTALMARAKNDASVGMAVVARLEALTGTLEELMNRELPPDTPSLSVDVFAKKYPGDPWLPLLQLLPTSRGNRKPAAKHVQAALASLTDSKSRLLATTTIVGSLLRLSDVLSLSQNGVERERELFVIDQGLRQLLATEPTTPSSHRERIIWPLVRFTIALVSWYRGDTNAALADWQRLGATNASGPAPSKEVSIAARSWTAVAYAQLSHNDLKGARESFYEALEADSTWEVATAGQQALEGRAQGQAPAKVKKLLDMMDRQPSRTLLGRVLGRLITADLSENAPDRVTRYKDVLAATGVHAGPTHGTPSVTGARLAAEISGKVLPQWWIGYPMNSEGRHLVDLGCRLLTGQMSIQDRTDVEQTRTRLRAECARWQIADPKTQASVVHSCCAASTK